MLGLAYSCGSFTIRNRLSLLRSVTRLSKRGLTGVGNVASKIRHITDALARSASCFAALRYSIIYCALRRILQITAGIFAALRREKHPERRTGTQSNCESRYNLWPCVPAHLEILSVQTANPVRREE
jgi:hypothetical protein